MLFLKAPDLHGNLRGHAFFPQGNCRRLRFKRIRPQKTQTDPENDGFLRGNSFQLWGTLVSMLVSGGCIK